MKTVGDLVRGRDVYYVRDGQTVREVARYMTERRVGAVVVMSGDRLAGILSERDIVGALARHGERAISMTAGELMTRPVQSCRPEDTIEQVMQVMTKRRFRHLPVLEDGQLTGIISIGDVVKSSLDQLQFERDQLDSYVHQT